MTTTDEKSPLDDLPYWEVFSLIFDRAIWPSMNEVKAKRRKPAFKLEYMDYYIEHGDKLSPLQYLELLIGGESEEVKNDVLIEGRNLLPTDLSFSASTLARDKPRKSARTARKPKSDAATKPHKKFSERFREFMEPTDTKEKEVTS